MYRGSRFGGRILRGSHPRWLPEGGTASHLSLVTRHLSLVTCHSSLAICLGSQGTCEGVVRDGQHAAQVQLFDKAEPQRP